MSNIKYVGLDVHKSITVIVVLDVALTPSGSINCSNHWSHL